MDDINWGHLLFGFDGRINRAKIWAGMVLQFAIVFATVAVAFAVNDPIGYWVAGIVNLVTVWMWVAISIKRWHDRGKSGWWLLIAIVPIIGSIWVFVETALLIGDSGTNRYGPDPLATGTFEPEATEVDGQPGA